MDDGESWLGRIDSSASILASSGISLSWMVLSACLTTPFFPKIDMVGAEADKELAKEEDDEEWLSFFREGGRVGDEGGEGEDSTAD